jgi:polyphenol oxidase
MISTQMVIRPTVFDDLPSVTAAFSTRHGGVSDPPYDTLNLGLTTGDNRSDVEENRRRFCEQLGVEPSAIVQAEQVHGNTVHVVDALSADAPPAEASPTGSAVRPPACDGFATRVPGHLLTIAVADCAAVLIAEAEAGVVGICHSGWRGTVANIAARTVDAMTSLGGSAATMRAYVSPCISVEAFEVGEEVAEQFDAAYVHRRDEWIRPHVDLKAVLNDQLVAAGLLDAHVEVSPYCTVNDNSDFYSYRAGNGTTGRLMGAIMVGE